MNNRKFTLRNAEGLYFTGHNGRLGFLAPGISGSYSYTLAEITALAPRFPAAEIVEVIPVPNTLGSRPGASFTPTIVGNEPSFRWALPARTGTAYTLEAAIEAADKASTTHTDLLSQAREWMLDNGFDCDCEELAPEKCLCCSIADALNTPSH